MHKGLLFERREREQLEKQIKSAEEAFKVSLDPQEKTNLEEAATQMVQ